MGCKICHIKLCTKSFKIRYILWVFPKTLGDWHILSFLCFKLIFLKMTTSFIAAEVTFEISWSVAFKWYIIQAGSLYLLICEKLLFALGVKGITQWNPDVMNLRKIKRSF